MSSTGVKRSLRHKIIEGVVGTMGLRLAYTAMTFATSVLLARTLGTAGFGIYSYAVVWAFLLSVPATLGLDNFIVREIAVYQSKATWPLLKGILTWADRAVLTASMGIAAVAIVVAWIVDGGNYSETWVGFCIAVALMPAISLRNVRRGAMRGLQHITKGLVPELLIDPLILISLTLIAYILLRERLSALWVIGFYGVGTVVTLLISSGLLKRTLPTPVNSVVAQLNSRDWLKSTLPFVLLESVPYINAQADVLMLGAFRTVEDVGLYVPVNRGAQLVTFISMAMSSTLAPTIASAYADNRLLDLQRTITKSIRVVAGVAFLFAASLIIGSPWYLGLFGEEFIEGRVALYILCVGSFISTSTGLSGVLLNMTGFERYAARIGWMTALLNIILNALFIPRWGVEGAALATSVSLVVRAFAKLIFVRRKLGIDVTLMGLPAKHGLLGPQIVEDHQKIKE